MAGRLFVLFTCLLVAVVFAQAESASATTQAAVSTLLQSFRGSRGSGGATHAAAPQCFMHSCASHEPFLAEVESFLDWAETRWPTRGGFFRPSANQLLRFACGLLSWSLGVSIQLLPGFNTMMEWWQGLISWSIWQNELGELPFAESPLYWCYLDEDSIYEVIDSYIVYGAEDIICTFVGLGRPVVPGQCGAGFWISELFFNDTRTEVSHDPGVTYEYSEVVKTLVSINFTTPGNVLYRASYGMRVTFANHVGFPLRTIALMQERLDPLRTAVWANLIPCFPCSGIC